VPSPEDPRTGFDAWFDSERLSPVARWLAPDATIAYSGDTGPTDRLWKLLNQEKNLKALLLELSFPDQYVL
jgi:ribonuclease BN (tRNA processing enzyme)